MTGDGARPLCGWAAEESVAGLRAGPPTEVLAAAAPQVRAERLSSCQEQELVVPAPGAEW